MLGVLVHYVVLLSKYFTGLNSIPIPLSPQALNFSSI